MPLCRVSGAVTVESKGRRSIRTLEAVEERTAEPMEARDRTMGPRGEV